MAIPALNSHHLYPFTSNNGNIISYENPLDGTLRQTFCCCNAQELAFISASVKALCANEMSARVHCPQRHSLAAAIKPKYDSHN